MSLDTTCTDDAPKPMTAAEKAEQAAVWASCPSWCEGVTHTEGITSEHSGEVGSVGAVAVAIVDRGDGLGVHIHADDYGTSDALLLGDDLTAFLALIDRAVAIVRDAEV